MQIMKSSKWRFHIQTEELLLEAIERLDKGEYKIDLVRDGKNWRDTNATINRLRFKR